MTAATAAPITDQQANLIGNRWQGRNGTVRYYINDWPALCGIEVERYKSGNIWSCHVPGYGRISNIKATRLLGGKLWIENGQLMSTINWADAGINTPAIADIIRDEIARREA